jgi:exodeoxyribonuclease VII small subunit
MADEKFTFEQARIRLEEIASEARKKDTSLERSLDLLEEGVRLANICTELVDHTDLDAHVEAPASELAVEGAVSDPPDEPQTPEPVDGEASEPVDGEASGLSAGESPEPSADESIEDAADAGGESASGDGDEIEEPLRAAD